MSLRERKKWATTFVPQRGTLEIGVGENTSVTLIGTNVGEIVGNLEALEARSMKLDRTRPQQIAPNRFCTSKTG